MERLDNLFAAVGEKHSRCPGSCPQCQAMNTHEQNRRAAISLHCEASSLTCLAIDVPDTRSSGRNGRSTPVAPAPRERKGMANKEDGGNAARERSMQKYRRSGFNSTR